MKKLLVVLSLVAVSSLWAQPVTIDGDFSDWDPGWVVDANPAPQPEGLHDHAIDPNNPTKYVDTDMHQIYVTDDSLYIYFYITFNDSADLYRLTDSTLYHGEAAVSIFMDLDEDSSTGLTWGWWAAGYDFYATVTHTDSGIVPSWGGVLPDAYGMYPYVDPSAHPDWGFGDALPDTPISAISIDEPYNALEVALPKAAIEGLGSSFYFLVVTQEQDNPWGGDYAPDEDVCGYGVYKYDLQNLSDAGITIDGDFSDWDGIDPMGAPLALYNEDEQLHDHSVDPNNPEKYVDTDMEDIYYVSDDQYLYFYVSFNDSTDLYRLMDSTLYSGEAYVALYIDVDDDSSTGMTWGWWLSGYDFLAAVTHTDSGIVPSWGGVLPDVFGFYVYDNTLHPNYGFVGPTGDTAEWAISIDEPYNGIEFAIPRSAVPNLPMEGRVPILVVVQEQDNPWGGDYYPNADALGYQKAYIDLTPSFISEDTRPNNGIAGQLRVTPSILVNNRLNLMFSLPEDMNVDVSIYDASGRLARTLYSGRLSSGTHTMSLSSVSLNPGVYFVRVNGSGLNLSSKLVVVK